MSTGPPPGDEIGMRAAATPFLSLSRFGGGHAAEATALNASPLRSWIAALPLTLSLACLRIFANAQPAVSECHETKTERESNGSIKYQSLKAARRP